MEFLIDLWMPIVVSAVLVFIASSVIHVALTYHRADHGPLPDEAAVSGLADVPPGNYVVPYAGSVEELKSEAYQAKVNAGPVGFLYLRPAGSNGMGASLVQWFLYSLLIGVFCAYLGSLTITAETGYFDKFQIVSTVAFLGYAFMDFNAAMWKAGKWSTALKFLFDGLVYALLTGGAFAGLWPAA